MTSRSPSPLEGVDRLLVDGTNLLHALHRGGPRQPAAALIGRLRGAIPPDVAIELVFDGAPDRGMRGERIASGVLVRYAGRRTADELLVSLVAERHDPADLVVTDDRDLRGELRSRGARTAGTAWLLGRLERRTLSAPGTGNPKPPADPRPPDADRPGWSPGRGATTKRGNPKRRPRSGRPPG